MTCKKWENNHDNQNDRHAAPILIISVVVGRMLDAADPHWTRMNAEKRG